MTPSVPDSPFELARVEQVARRALRAADVVDIVPTPLERVGAALQLEDAVDLSDLDDLPKGLLTRLRRLKGKVLGALAIRERVVFVDKDQPAPRARFAYGHELGHEAMPWHKDAYYGDDYLTLAPEARAELESEANAFSADLLFQIGRFTEEAASSRVGLAVPLGLSQKYGTSRHPAIRRYVERNPAPCALAIFGRFPVHPRGKESVKILVSLESPSFRSRFGHLNDCLPSVLGVEESELGEAVKRSLLGTLAPVLDGTVRLEDSRRGPITLRFEVFSNTYRVFALIYAKPRLDLRARTRAEWING